MNHFWDHNCGCRIPTPLFSKHIQYSFVLSYWFIMVSCNTLLMALEGIWMGNWWFSGFLAVLVLILFLGVHSFCWGRTCCLYQLRTWFWKALHYRWHHRRQESLWLDTFGNAVGAYWWTFHWCKETADFCRCFTGEFHFHRLLVSTLLISWLLWSVLLRLKLWLLLSRMVGVWIWKLIICSLYWE